MSDEFDDAIDMPPRASAATARDTPKVPARLPAARLVSRLYAAANAPLRARMLACLLQPLSPLSLVAIAAGAFGTFLHRGGDPAASVTLGDVSRFSNDQIFELARFVEQVSPDALQTLACVVADSPLVMAAFSASVALLLVRAMQRKA
jgi:hypothetical protein